MKTRDFCYWFKGFIELQDQYVTIKQWNTILEHLTLVKDNVENKNKLTQTEKTVLMLWGFVQVANPTKPTQEQWNRIVAMVNDMFENISKEVEVNSAEESSDLNKILEELEKKNKREPWRKDPKDPFEPYPHYGPISPPKGDDDKDKLICAPTIECYDMIYTDEKMSQKLGEHPSGMRKS